MHLRKKLLSSSRFYVIVKSDFERAKQIILSSVDVIQLRDKEANDRKLLTVAKKLASFCKKRKILFIVNDRLDIAVLSGADGVHVGQEDLPLKEIKKLCPKNFLLGVSTHSVKEARKAQDEGADYIGFGPVFATKTKPHLKPVGVKKISILNKKIRIPFFVIGDVKLSNLEILKRCGVKRIALHSAIYNSRIPKEKIKVFKKELR